jgi:hypothetical protein
MAFDNDRLLKKLSSTLSLHFSKTLPNQNPYDKISYSTMMILKSLNQKSTHQRYSKPHRKPSNLKESLKMVTTGFGFSLLIQSL